MEAAAPVQEEPGDPPAAAGGPRGFSAQMLGAMNEVLRLQARSLELQEAQLLALQLGPQRRPASPTPASPPSPQGSHGFKEWWASMSEKEGVLRDIAFAGAGGSRARRLSQTSRWSSRSLSGDALGHIDTYPRTASTFSRRPERPGLGEAPLEEPRTLNLPYGAGGSPVLGTLSPRLEESPGARREAVLARLEPPAMVQDESLTSGTSRGMHELCSKKLSSDTSPKLAEPVGRVSSGPAERPVSGEPSGRTPQKEISGFSRTQDIEDILGLSTLPETKTVVTGESSLRPPRRLSLLSRTATALSSVLHTPSAASLRSNSSRLSQFGVQGLMSKKVTLAYRSYSGLPDEVPARVRAMLLLIGAVGPVDEDGDDLGWRCCLFRVYRYLLAAVWCLAIAANAAYAAVQLARSSFPLEVLYALCMLLALPLWRSVISQLGLEGPSRMLLHEMTRRCFDWGQESSSVLRHMAFYLFMVGFTFFQSFRRRDILQETCVVFHTEPRLEQACQATFIVGLLTQVLALAFMVVLLWAVRFLCHLHRHELIWYGGALAELLMQNGARPNMMHRLHEAEILVTGRLRQASETWVLNTCLFVGCLCLMVVVLVTLLMSNAKQIEDPLQAISALVAFVFVSIFMGIPLAQVAEVFDYDVLRALNNPLVLKNAQREFGQQLLPHLHTLEWGFRIGQTVINMKLIMNLGLALAISMITALTDSIMQTVQ